VTPPTLRRALAAAVGAPSTLLPDGSIWSHAAVPGTFWYRGEQATLDHTTFASFVANFRAGSPGKVPVDYDHGSFKADGTGPFPKSGDVLELRDVAAAADLPAAALAQIAALGRDADDQLNFGLWVRWKPTERALGLLRAREYTEMSICFGEPDSPPRTGEPQGPTLYSIALTNTPHLDDMVPIAARRSDGGNAPAAREDSTMTTSTFLSRLSALLGRAIGTEDQAATAAEEAVIALRADVTRREATIAELKPGADGFRALAAELAETDPAKAVAKVKELRATAAAATARAEKEETKALAGDVDKILRTHETKFVPAEKTFLSESLTAELRAGTKPGETKLEKILAVRPAIAAFERRSGADSGRNPDAGAELDELTAQIQKDEKVDYGTALGKAERTIALRRGGASATTKTA
jgi:phage I-like protein